MIAGWERTSFPAVPGHEWSGVVDAVGQGVDPELAGRPCVAENVWADGGEVGFEHPGGYAQYLLTEAANVQVLPAGFPAARAVLIEPLAVVVRALRRLRPDPPGPILVFGDGPIGLLVLLLLRRSGRSDVMLAGGRARRLALAAHWGVPTANYHHTDLRAQRGFGTVIEASGSAAALHEALDITQPGGRILLLGDYGQGRADFPWSRPQNRELEIIGTNASAGAWPEAVRLAVEGNLPLDDLITHRLPAARFAEGVSLVRERASGAIKVVLTWD